MNKTLSLCGLGLMMSMALIGMPGCSKKSVQSGGDPSPLKGWQRKRRGSIVPCPVSAAFLTPVVSRVGGGLGGIDKNPQKSVWAAVR